MPGMVLGAWGRSVSKTKFPVLLQLMCILTEGCVRGSQQITNIIHKLHSKSESDIKCGGQSVGWTKGGLGRAQKGVDFGFRWDGLGWEAWFTRTG